MDFDAGLVAQIVTGLLGILAAVFGGKLMQARKYAKRTLDLLNYIQEVLQDGKMQAAEVDGFIDRARALINGKPYKQDK
jgi:hypothetical protein